MGFKLFLPETLIFITGLVSLILDVTLKRERKSAVFTVSIGGLLVALSITVLFFEKEGLVQGFRFTQYLRFFDIIYIFGGLILLLLTPEVLTLKGEYSFFFFTAILGMMLLSKAQNIFLIFLSLEVLSFSLYALVGFLKESELASEAVMKYFLLGAFSSAFLLLGFVVLYMATGEVMVENIMRNLLSLKEGVYLRLDIFSALLLVLIGFGFKLLYVPFQFWTPDVFEGTPAPVAGFLSSLPKAAAFAALIKIVNFSFIPLKLSWHPLIYVLSILTMFWGNLSALRERNLKKMLAYSTIAHAGYMLVGILANTPQGFSALAFYLFVYTLMSVAAFGSLNYFGFNPSLDDATGFAKRNPLPALLFTISLVSLSGIPPTAGFIAKFYIFMSAVSTGHRTLAIIGFLNSAISAYYYMRVVVHMYMLEREEKLERKTLVFTDSALLLSAFFLLLLGILPGSLFYLSTFKF